MAAGGYSLRATLPSALAAGSYLSTFHPDVRTLVAEGMSHSGERRLPLRTAALLLILVVTPAYLLSGFTLGIPVLIIAGLRPSPVWAIAAVAGLAATVPLAISADRMDRRWIVIAPRGLVVHDPFLLSAGLRIPPQAIEYVEPGGKNWRSRIEDPATFLDLTAGALSKPLLVRLRSRVEAPQPRRIGIGMAFPPGGCVTLVAVCPVDPRGAFASLARAGYARPGEFARLQTST